MSEDPKVEYNPLVQVAFVFAVFAAFAAFAGMLVMFKALSVVGSL